MGILNRFQALFSQKAAPDQTFGGTWVSLTGAHNDGVNEHNLLLNNKEWVFASVNLIANSTASVRYKVMRYKRNGDDTEVFDGPLIEFLEKPGQGFTGKDFIYLNTVYKELTGNAFWLREKKGKVSPLLPNKIAPKVYDDKLVGYKYRTQGVERNYQLEDILHDRYIDPARPYWGVGKLSKIARWVDTSGFANEFLRQFFLQGSTFGGFITTEEESRERIKLIQAGMANDHAGVANAHKWAVLPKGSKAERATANMSEIEMGATDDRYRDKILSAFGVPKSLLGLVQDVNRANAEANEYVYARYTIKPIVDDLMEFLNEYVAAVLDPSGQYYFAYDEFVPINQELKLREREIGLNRQQYMTINEVRAEDGLPPVNGGDVIYAAPFQVPLGTTYQAPEAPVAVDTNPDDDVPEEPKKSRSRGISARVRAFAKRQKARDDLYDTITSFYRSFEEDREVADAAAHKDFVGRVESFFERIENAVRTFNSEQQSRVVGDLQRITKAVSKSDLFDMTEEIALMVNFVEPILRGLMSEQALAEYEAQGFEGVFDSGDSHLSKTIERATARLAKTYNATTAALLKKELNDGIGAGEGLADLTKRVQQVYEFSDTTRAKMVAHTESFYIANEGSKEAYRQSGVVQSIRWYTAEDERVCPWCEPQNGKIVGVNDNFYAKGETVVGTDGKPLELNYRSINVPPLHSNCRCFVRPEDISID